MRLTLLLPALLFAITSLKSQNKFPGYFVNLTGDTVRGNFPSYKQSETSPFQIDFVSANGNATLTPANTKGFSITDFDTYESKHIRRMLNPIELTEGFNETDTTNRFDERDAFVRVVYNKGGVKVYEFKDLQRPNYYIQYKSDTLTELENKVYLKNNLLVEERKYRNQLNFLFLENIMQNKKLAIALEDLRYQPEELSTFLDKVQKIKVEGGTKTKKQFDLLLITGLSMNSFEVTRRNYSFKPSMVDYPTTFAPVFGIGINMYSRRNLGKNIATAQLKFWNFKNGGGFSESADNYQFSFESKVATLAVGFGRNWVHTSNLSWYTTVAPEVTALIGSKTNGSTMFMSPFKDKMLDLNVNFQTGIVIKRKFGVWASYNLAGFDTRAYLHYRSIHQPLQLGVDWRIKL